MRYKKIMMLTIILACLLAVSAVSAAENATEDIVSADDTDDQVINVEENQVVEQQDTKESIGNPDNGTFAALQKRIEDAGENGVVNLENNYTLESGYKLSGINISKPVTINGNGHAIDANSHARIFFITANSVILKNITFKNAIGYLVTGQIKEGGAIYCSGDDLNVSSCTFDKCSDETKGASIYNGGANCNICSCDFTNGYADDQGGAIYNSGKDCVISSCVFTSSSIYKNSRNGGTIANDGENCIIRLCNFTDCYSSRAGAIYNKAKECKISYCDFTNCSAGYYGAIYNSGLECRIQSCNFTDCFATIDCGAVCNNGDDSTIDSCNFKNCSSMDLWGAAVSTNGVNCKVISCNFTDCSANGTGGSLENGGEDCEIISCNFTNCSANWEGGAIVNHAENCLIGSCIFKDCSSLKNAGAIYNNGPNSRVSLCTFINCSAGEWGGAILNNYDGTDIHVDSCTVTDCHANWVAGAFYIRFGGHITSCNITGCESICIYSENSVEVKNCRFPDLNENEVGFNTVYINCIFKDSNSNSTNNDPKPINDNQITIPSLDSGSGTIKLPNDASGTITLDIVGKPYNFNVVNGVCDVKLPELDNGIYGYIITYSGDTKYASFTKTGSMKVNKTTVTPVDNKTTTTGNTSHENTTVVDNSKIEASNVKVTYAAGSYYSIKVYGANGELANGASVKISGKISKTLTTTNGIDKFKITQVPGTYKITITALGKSVSKTITVTKATPKITAKAKSFKKSVKTKKYTIKLNVNQKVKVAIKVNKKIYHAYTNTKGQATFKITKLTKKGKYTATVSSVANNCYNKAKSVNVKIAVK